MEHQPEISARKLALLALLAAPIPPRTRPQPIDGITRLQKLTFLVFNEVDKVSPDRRLPLDFQFEPNKYGPADVGLYSDLDFLIALGHVERKSGMADPSDFTAAKPGAGDREQVPDTTEQELNFDYLMADETGAADLAAAERPANESYRITDAGSALLKRIGESASGRSAETVKAILESAFKVKATFGQWPLARLLRYVYAEHPAMTTESEIRDRVFRY